MAGSAKLSGVDAMKAKLFAAKRNGPVFTGDALWVEMKIEEIEAKKRTPVKSGKLRNTVRREGPFMNGQSVMVLIVAGSEDVQYAAVVHEDLEAFHEVGEAKFIESTLRESRSFIGVRVARRLNISDWVR